MVNQKLKEFKERVHIPKVIDPEIILSLDQSLRSSGVCVWNSKQNRLIYSDVIKITSSVNYADAVLFIGEQVKELLEEYKPDLVLTENRISNTANRTSKQTIVKLAMVEAIILYQCHLSKVPVKKVNPRDMRSYHNFPTGDKGKLACFEFYKNKYPQIKTNDQSDAIANLITFLNSPKYA